MAEAGFYFCGGDNEPDLAKCFFCSKELDGWEPEDDPWSEHEKHARGNCAYINLGKKPGDLLVKDMYHLEVERLAKKWEKHLEDKIESFKKEAAKARDMIAQV